MKKKEKLVALSYQLRALSEQLLEVAQREPGQNDPALPLLEQIVSQEPVDILYQRIEKLQEYLALLLLQRLYHKCNKNWKEMVKKCHSGETPETWLKEHKMNKKIKRLYHLITGKIVS